MPGWSATVDGVPVNLPPGLWREVEIGPGEHTVEFAYVPPGLKSGLAAAGLALLVLFSMVLWDRRRTPDQPKKQE